MAWLCLTLLGTETINNLSVEVIEISYMSKSVGKSLNEDGNINVTLDYYPENIHTSSKHTTTKTSNEPVDMIINTYDSSRNRWSITLDRYSVFGNISMYLGVDEYELTESTGYGIACDGYFLTKE